MEIPNHLNIVKSVKADLVMRHVPLGGPCGAFEITKGVAWQLRGEGAGLLSKPEGNNCQGYSTDIVCYPDGTIIDILFDAGGANSPTWDQKEETVDLDRYRLAIPPSAVTPVSTDYDDAQVVAFVTDCKVLTEDFGRISVVGARMEHDANVGPAGKPPMGYAAARVKQYNELKTELGK